MGLFDAFGVGGGSLSLQVQFPQVQAGGVLQGVVAFVAGRREQRIENIKVTLNCTTHQMVPGQPHPQQRTEAIAPPMMVSGAFSAQAGQQYQFPFQVQVPPSAFGSQPNAVTYRLHASADIDGEIDPGAGQDIQVVGAPYHPGMMQPGMMQPGMMQPGMVPMGGPQPGWDPHGAMPGGTYSQGVEHAYNPGYDKAAGMKGGYDPGYDKAAGMKGGYDPGQGQGGFAPGTRAQAQWNDGGWYGVTILQQQGQQVLVQWDDGTPPSWVGLHQVAL